MNWTGGRLSRHSHNGPGTLAHRQKQHFANKRSKPANGIISRAPTDWSVFGVMECQSPQQDTDLIKYVRPARSYSYGRLEEDHSSNNRSQKNCQHDSSQECSRTRENPPLQTLANWKIGLYDRRYIKRETDDADGADDGAAQGVAETKRPSPLPGDDAAEMSNGEASFTERRRNILHKNDWVGANIQHPIKLKFATTNNDQRLGKRRRLSAGHHPQFTTIPQPRGTSPFAASRLNSVRELAKAPRINGITNFSIGPSPNHIRISTGGTKIPADVGSNGTQRRPLEHLISSQASTSDIMLLDTENNGRDCRSLQPSSEMQQQKSDPLLHMSTYQDDTGVGKLMAVDTRTPHRRRINSSYGSIADIGRWSARSALTGSNVRVSKGLDVDAEISGMGGFRDEKRLKLVNYEPNGTARTPVEHQPKLATLHGYSAKLIRAKPNREHTEGGVDIPRVDDPRSTPPPAIYITNVSKQLSESAKKLQSVARDKSRRRSHPSSQTKILHPIPQSSITSRVLLSPCSSSGGSNIAQFEATQPLVSPSQAMDEEIWKSWILPMEDVEGLMSSDVRDVAVSPVLNVTVRQNQTATRPTRDNPDEAWLKFILSDEIEVPLIMTPRKGRKVPSPSSGANNSSVLVTIGSDSSLDPLSMDSAPVPLNPLSQAATASIPRKRKMTFSKPPRFTTRRRRGSSSPDPLSVSEKPPVHIGSRRQRKERAIYSVESEQDGESIEDGSS